VETIRGHTSVLLSTPVDDHVDDVSRVDRQPGALTVPEGGVLAELDPHPLPCRLVHTEHRVQAHPNDRAAGDRLDGEPGLADELGMTVARGVDDEDLVGTDGELAHGREQLPGGDRLEAELVRIRGFDAHLAPGDRELRVHGYAGIPPLTKQSDDEGIAGGGVRRDQLDLRRLDILRPGEPSTQEPHADEREAPPPHPCSGLIAHVGLPYGPRVP
jgi:hypothetical protein